ncbi:MAG: WG repeat-containing protein [Candidatus Treponema excrementipullorum]|uniref:WG repeat-containing protein n=1 Tax=Candidatus Treponema excrementipullorum TaxID=2838768 RepID=A0A9E2NXY1_9SPIR|nr:WG repeat-containing protein [Candidatus Treponema excrementipullorum]
MNIRKLVLLFFTVCMAAFCYGNGGKEPDILIPYRLDGKWGFVNQRLEKVTDAEYEYRRDVAKYFVLAYKNAEWFVILCDGQEIKVGNQESNPVAIGDEYFTIQELIPRRDGERYKTTIYSVFDGEIAVFYDWRVEIAENSKSLEYIKVYDSVWYNCNYMNAKGELKFPYDEYIDMYSFDESLGRGVMRNDNEPKQRCAIIDKDMNIIKKFSDLSEKFSDGLIAGIEEDEYRDLEKLEIPGGYYDVNGEKRISVIFHKSPIKSIYLMQSFNSGVLPCRIVGGEIHVMGNYSTYEENDWGIIDTEGNIIASHITAKEIEEFSGGVANIITENNEGKEEVRLINTKGEIITKDAFDTIEECVNGYCVAQKDGEDYLISAKDGKSYRCRDFK